MARLPYLDPPGEIADRIRQRRGGRLRPLDQVLLHSPPMAEAWNQMLGAVRQRSSLPDDVRELVILRVAALNGADYEWEAHEEIGRRAGLGDAELAYLRTGAGPSPLGAAQQAAFDFASASTRTCEVPEEVFAAARHALGEAGVVDLAVTTGAYNMVSRFLTALDVGERLGTEAVR